MCILYRGCFLVLDIPKYIKKNKVITYEGDNAEISWRPLSDMVTICNNMVKGKFR